MTTCWNPASISRRRVMSSSGFPSTSTKAFGRWSVNGFSRVPSPAAKSIAFLIRIWSLIVGGAGVRLTFLICVCRLAQKKSARLVECRALRCGGAISLFLEAAVHYAQFQASASAAFNFRAAQSHLVSDAQQCLGGCTVDAGRGGVFSIDGDEDHFVPIRM